MPKISVLPDFIASQIAAGEVVERPSSVVKELVENAIDAGASQIEIAVGAECRDIRVADDGCGMSADDAVLAFQRHATSKLNSADDLSSLTTLGFRGEALPSIASVSQMSCTTKTADAESGTKVVVDEGKVTARETGCSVGTIIEVCELFYNVPARLKFLKKSSTEFAHIHEIVQSLALAHPKIVFQLLNQGEVVLKTSGSGKLAETMTELKLVNPKQELVPITGVEMRLGMAVYGHVGRPPLCRGDRKSIITIVNNRPVRCHLAIKALDYAFSDLIPKGKHPIAVLSITIDPQQVDVNVHPTKKEIRYSNSSDVYLTIQKALIEGTRKFPETPVHDDSGSERNEPDSGTDSSRQIRETAAPYSSNSTDSTTGSITSGAASAPESREIEVGGRTYQRVQQLGLRERLTTSLPSRISNTGQIQAPVVTAKAQASLPVGWRFAGYVYNTYMLFDTPDGLRVVEQHIAHERVIYERILAQQKQPGRISENTQRLIISAPLNLAPEQRACLGENLEFMRKLGFDFEIQPQNISCTQVPLELATKDYAGTVQNIIEQLLKCDSAEFSLEATKSLACQAAIKNGMGLTETEIVDLVAAWHDCPRNDTCPHGRPVSLNFSRERLFEMFHPK